MSDWAEMQAWLMLPRGKTVISDTERAELRAALTEALWQAYENGIKEGELRYLRPLTKPTVMT